MERKPFWIIAAALVFGLLVAWSFWSKIEKEPEKLARPAPIERDNVVPISIASSSNKGEWIDQAIASFNAASEKQADFQLNGKPVVVTAILEGKEHYRSGTMVTDILSGKIKPVIASPAEDSWILKLKKEWHALNSKQLITKTVPGVARTPLVIAMWDSRARALDCWPSPKPLCSWDTVRSLASSPDGWKRFGRPDWGKFKIGYGYVGESNSGTLTSAILCMRGLGKTSGLTLNDVSATNGCGQMISDVEKAKVHSGRRSAWLLDRMRSGGPEYLDAIITNEQEVIEFNHNREGLREPMVSAYLQDGTVVITHPFAILDGAPWVSAEQLKGAEIFQRYLLSTEQQTLLVKNGLRPANAQAPLGPPIETAFGANPTANLTLIEVPETLVFDRVREVWHEVKKHARIAIVFDKSSSMSGEKISYAVKGAQEFVTAMDTKDWLAWFAFDDQVYPLSHGYKSSIGENLLSAIRSTTAGGGTALYDAVSKAFDVIAEDRQKIGDGVRYGIVILSDGQDTSSKSSTLTLLESKLKPSEGDPTGIQIHTIGIGGDSDEQVLKKIANLAHGRYWKVETPADVVEVYKEIATYY
jgi:Ca-activated chloride channel homolog